MRTISLMSYIKKYEEKSRIVRPCQDIVGCVDFDLYKCFLNMACERREKDQWLVQCELPDRTIDWQTEGMLDYYIRDLFWVIECYDQERSSSNEKQRLAIIEFSLSEGSYIGEPVVKLYDTF